MSEGPLIDGCSFAVIEERLRSYSRELADIQRQLDGLPPGFAEWVKECFRGRDLALSVALGTLDGRLEVMNEFRAAMGDQAKNFLTRSEFTVVHAEVMRNTQMLRIDGVKLASQVEEHFRASISDRADIMHRIEAGVAARAILADQASTFARRNDTDAAIKHLGEDYTRVEQKINVITSRLDKMEGLTTAAATRTTTMIAIIMAVAAFLTVGLTYFTNLNNQSILQEHMKNSGESAPRVAPRR
jgi:hypothetical protein